MRHAVIVSPDVSNQAGGVERMCVLLADVLAQQGWETTVVGPSRRANVWEFRLGADYLARSRLAARTARELRPDLIITNGFLGVGYGRRVPRVHVYHGTMVGATLATGAHLPRRERLRRTAGAGAAEALSARGATVVCVSAVAAAEAQRYYRVGDATVIPNGVDTATFRKRPRAEARRRMGLDPDSRYALYVGRMDYGKGVDLIVPAARRAGVRLLVAGPGSSNQATHLGVLAPGELADAYAATDCVLFPSRYEACSFVVLEALACGVPLISTRVGWLPTLLASVPEYEALCVRPTVEDVTDRLRRLGGIDTDPIVARARDWVLEHNSLERYSERWTELLTNVAAPGDTALAGPGVATASSAPN